MNTSLPTERILSKLDSYFAKNDYEGAERHLKYWLNEAIFSKDYRTKLMVCNERTNLIFIKWHGKTGINNRCMNAFFF